MSRLADRRRRTQASFYRLFDGVALDGGIWAAVTPSSPERSLVNAVTYEDPAAVVAARDRLAELYAAAGVRAWTVWVQPGDRELAAALEAAGHALDARPEAMACDLTELDLAGDTVGEAVAWEDAVALNEAAYGLAPGTLAGFPRLDPPDVRLVGVPGRAVVGVHEHDGDAGVTLVATHPEARGRGLCTALMRQALRDARGRGCTTSSLESSAAGRPVYARLGFRALGTLEMWEHRV